MSDEPTAAEYVREAWENCDLPQSRFAEILRYEADLYEEAPELAAGPDRSAPIESISSEVGSR